MIAATTTTMTATTLSAIPLLDPMSRLSLSLAQSHKRTIVRSLELLG